MISSQTSQVRGSVRESMMTIDVSRDLWRPIRLKLQRISVAATHVRAPCVSMTWQLVRYSYPVPRENLLRAAPPWSVSVWACSKNFNGWVAGVLIIALIVFVPVRERNGHEHERGSCLRRRT